MRRSTRSRFLDDIPDTALSHPVGETPTGLSARERRAELASRRALADPVDDGPQTPAYEAGEQVIHEKFGPGVVVSCEVVPGDQHVTVAFREHGVKKLMLSFAPLGSVEQPSAESVPFEDAP